MVICEKNYIYEQAKADVKIPIFCDWTNVYVGLKKAGRSVLLCVCTGNTEY